MVSINKMKIEVQKASNDLYQYETLHGSTPMSKVFGKRAKRIIRLFNYLESIGTDYNELCQGDW